MAPTFSADACSREPQQLASQVGGRERLTPPLRTGEVGTGGPIRPRQRINDDEWIGGELMPSSRGPDRQVGTGKKQGARLWWR